jgi:hypothetical protein
MCRVPRRNKKYVTRKLVMKRDHFGDIDVSLNDILYCNECYRNGVVDYGVDC